MFKIYTFLIFLVFLLACDKPSTKSAFERIERLDELDRSLQEDKDKKEQERLVQERQKRTDELDRSLQEDKDKKEQERLVQERQKRTNTSSNQGNGNTSSYSSSQVGNTGSSSRTCPKSVAIYFDVLHQTELGSSLICRAQQRPAPEITTEGDHVYLYNWNDSGCLDGNYSFTYSYREGTFAGDGDFKSFSGVIYIDGSKEMYLVNIASDGHIFVN